MNKSKIAIINTNYTFSCVSNDYGGYDTSITSPQYGSISYPTGFNKDNCVAVAIEYTIDTRNGSSFAIYQNQRFAQSYSNIIFEMAGVKYRNDDLRIHLTPVDMSEQYTVTGQFKIVLMRID